MASDRLIVAGVPGLQGLQETMASPISASWNQLYAWLSGVDGLRRAA